MDTYNILLNYVKEPALARMIIEDVKKIEEEEENMINHIRAIQDEITRITYHYDNSYKVEYIEEYVNVDDYIQIDGQDFFNLELCFHDARIIMENLIEDLECEKELCIYNYDLDFS